MSVDAELDPHVFDAAATRYRGVPCPFLSNGACSIYRHRPLACRRQISLADDDSPCRLNGDEDTDVPYLDRFDAKLAAVIAMGLHSGYADVREWFPAGP
jgi:Fe-S-cluster containining protein